MQLEKSESGAQASVNSAGQDICMLKLDKYKRENTQRKRFEKHPGGNYTHSGYMPK